MSAPTLTSKTAKPEAWAGSIPRRLPVQQPGELLEILRMPWVRIIAGEALHPQDYEALSEVGQQFLWVAEDSFRFGRAFDLGLLPKPALADHKRAREASINGQILAYNCVIAFIPCDRLGLALGPARAFIVRDCGSYVDFLLVEGLPGEDDLPTVRVIVGGRVGLEWQSEDTRGFWHLATPFTFTWAIERLLVLLTDATAAHYGEIKGVNAFSDPWAG